MSETAHPGTRFHLAPWLWQPIAARKALYLQVALAAVIINLLSLATSLFSMTVYDRVVPNNAIESLIALSIGISIILVADFILKSIRAYFIDIAGARIDGEVGNSIFAKLLSMRLDGKRGSTGAFAGVLREFETLRDFFTSATMTAFVDVPFVALFLLVIFLIGGKLVLVPLLMVPLVVGVSLATRPALDRLSGQMMKQGLNKQGVLVETVGGIETIKAARAGRMFAQRWARALNHHSESGLRQRLVATISTTTAMSAQNISYIGTVVFGVHLIGTGQLTMGGLIACSILSGRCVAPLGQVAQLLTKLTSTKTAYQELDKVMTAPDEAVGSPVRRKSFEGAIEFRDVTFRYGEGGPPILDKVSFKIKPGERVAMLGKVGSGKSTILRLIMALRHPQEGTVLIDGVDIRQHHPEDLRGAVGAVLQEGLLFSGTVRDNIALGRSDVDDEEMIRCATLSGTHSFMANLANGYELTLADKGEGLSGGQRQSIAIARALASRPGILLMDEPTSAMDAGTETALIQRLGDETKGRTLLVVTHRPPLLAIVDRIILIEGGKVVLDGPRDEVIARLQGKQPGQVQPQAQAQGTVQ
ncbi:type I secretion system permease/ATPase [Sphingomonas sp. ID0503]|uniref:type I secretion system permease/ATPase n=1 Tax=Sphingomonas sp. ID0503 TaxID=3399691 RepID=UPI003AFB632D